MDRKYFRDSEMSDLQTKTMYCEQQLVYFKDISSNELKVIARVLIRSGMSCNSEKTFQVLLIDIEDICNPFFCLTGKISRDDYTRIKSELGLLINFNKFLIYFVDLLRKCKDSEETDKTRFLLKIEDNSVLDSNNLSFAILELNDLRQLCLMKYNLHYSSEEEIRKLVCKKYQDLQKQNFEKDRILESLKNSLTEYQRQYENKCDELEKHASHYAEEMKRLSLQCLNDVTQEKEKADSAISELNQKFKEDLRIVEKENAEAQQNLNDKLNELKLKCDELSQKNAELKMKHRDLKGAITAHKGIESEIRQELDKLRSEKMDLEIKLQNKERERKDQILKYKDLLKDFNTTSEELKLMTSRAEGLESVKMKLENEIQERNIAFQKQTSVLNNISKEHMKANEILRKMTESQGQYEASAIQSNKIILELEKLLSSAQNEAFSLKSQIENITKEKAELEMSLAKCKESLSNSEKDLKEKDDTIKKNEGVISFLTQKLRDVNDRQFPVKRNIPNRNLGNIYATSQIPRRSVPTLNECSSSVSLESKQPEDTSKKTKDEEKVYTASAFRKLQDMPSTGGLESKFSSYFPRR